MVTRRAPIDLTPAVRPERWTVTSKATGESRTVEARLAIDAWKVAKLRDGDSVLLPYSAVSVAPASDETTGRSHKSSARRGAKAAPPPARSAPEPSSPNGRGRVDATPSPAAAAPVRRNGHKHPRAEGSR